MNHEKICKAVCLRAGADAGGGVCYQCIECRKAPQAPVAEEGAESGERVTVCGHHLVILYHKRRDYL